MIRPLTSLRFFFAFFVFLSHLFFIYPDSPRLYKLKLLIFEEGFCGVTFFFILSGFIMAHSYENKFKLGTISVKNFFIARIGRIYPTHFFALLLTIPYSDFDFSIKWFIYFSTHFFLFQSYIPYKDLYFAFNTPSWSISNEFFFYACFPFLVLKRISWKWIFAFIFIILISFYTFNMDYQHAFLYVNPIYRIFDFIIGLFIFQFKNINDFRLVQKYPNFFEVFSVLLFILFLTFHSYIPIGFRFSMYYWLPGSFLIFIFSFQLGIISKILSHLWLVILGEASFAFYMFHTIFIMYFMKNYMYFPFYFKSGYSMIFIFTVIQLFSILFHFKVEKPMNKITQKLLNRLL